MGGWGGGGEKESYTCCESRLTQMRGEGMVEAEERLLGSIRHSAYGLKRSCKPIVINYRES